MTAEDVEEISAVAGQVLLKVMESVDPGNEDEEYLEDIVTGCYTIGRLFNAQHLALWKEAFPDETPPDEAA